MSPAAEGTVLLGKFKVCPASREVLLEDRRIDLPWRCFEALLVLMESGGEVVERETFFRRLWPNTTVEESNLNQAIARLRKELGDQGDIIETVPRRGYRLLILPVMITSPNGNASPSHESIPRPPWRRRLLVFSILVLAVGIPAVIFGGPRWSKHRQAVGLVEEGFHLVRENRTAQLAEAVSRFSRAVELEPNLALGYAGLAEAMARSVNGSRSHAREMAERSLRIDPRCAECRAIAGWILMVYEWQFADALQNLQTAARQKPDDARIQLWNAQALACSGRLDQALHQIDHAISLNPTDAAPVAMRAGILYFMRRYEESMRAAQLALGLHAGYTSANDWIYRSGIAAGRIEEALEAKASLTAAFTGMSVDLREQREQRWNEAYRSGGIEPLVREFLDETSQGLALVENRYDRAALRMRIGDTQGALDELEQVFEWRPFHCIYMGVDPAFEGIRDEPRFRKVLARIGLDRILISQK